MRVVRGHPIKTVGVTQGKDLSQILYLIIAASVLMMIALSLIFMFNDSVGGSETSSQACRSSVQSQCQFSGATNIQPPSNCVTEAGDGTREIISSMRSRATGSYENGDDVTISCPSNQNNA